MEVDDYEKKMKNDGMMVATLNQMILLSIVVVWVEVVACGKNDKKD